MVISVNCRLIEITKQTITGPDLDGVGAIRLVPPPPPGTMQKYFMKPYFCAKLRKTCVSLAQSLLPDINNQPFGHDSCCYVYHLL